MITTRGQESKSASASRPSARKRDERGSVLTEFTMVAPIMILIAGSALRFYQELQAQEIAITFAREVATLAYNRCLDRTSSTVVRDPLSGQETITGDEDQTLNGIGACLQDEVLNSFVQTWSIAKPIAGSNTVTVTVEAYRCDIGAISAITCAKKGKISCVQSLGGAATCTKDLNATKNDLTAFRNRMVFAKIQFVMAPLATFIPSIASRTVTYDASV